MLFIKCKAKRHNNLIILPAGKLLAELIGNYHKRHWKYNL